MTYRRARALDQLVDQVDELAPHRDRRSDGWIGDAEHATRDSDHNPWIKLDGVGIVTAQDLDHDPAGGFDAHALGERLRRQAAAGTEPRIKYLISRRRIASSRDGWIWRPYTGVNAHAQHLHVSVRPEPRYFDSQRSWQIGDDDVTLDDFRKLIPSIADAVWSAKLSIGDYSTSARGWLTYTNRKVGQLQAGVAELGAVVDELAGRSGVTPAELEAIRSAVRAELADAVVDVDVTIADRSSSPAT